MDIVGQIDSTPFLFAPQMNEAVFGPHLAIENACSVPVSFPVDLLKDFGVFKRAFRPATGASGSSTTMVLLATRVKARSS